VVFQNQDGFELVGFLQGENDPQSGLGVLYLHGKGGNFYTGPSRYLPAGLLDAGHLQLAMNMRCHDLGYTRYDIESADITAGGAECDGGAWERTAEGWKDLRAGVDLLLARGCRQVVLVGHSSGGLYTGVYQDDRAVIAGRVFLSPLMTSRTAFQVWFRDAEERQHARRQAAALVADGRGETLLTLPCWYYAISARSLLERLEEPEDFFGTGLSGWHEPVLGIWGALEDRCPAWEQRFAELTDRPCRTLRIPDAGHHYAGHEAKVGDAVRAFLAEVSPTGSGPPVPAPLARPRSTP
jgi:pimeloyl-ACP methyl ester carboxylesterase